MKKKATKVLSSKSAATSNNYKLTKSDINQVIIFLELSANVCIRYYETAEELRDLVLCYTKAVGEYLIKHDASENLIFCDKGVDKSGTKISKEGHGLINLWKDVLQSFNLVTNDQAQAICSLYPSPLLLKKVFAYISCCLHDLNYTFKKEKNVVLCLNKKAYEAADRTNSGELLLADIQVSLFCCWENL